ncbi:RNA polymerase sigma factor, partial [Lentzea pudingi]|uniref:RNA polymerase sigma factor n=1 Tax=Lentzea pudingi TaxID=1789439 RepID=UPI001E60A946
MDAYPYEVLLRPSSSEQLLEPFWKELDVYLTPVLRRRAWSSRMNGGGYDPDDVVQETLLRLFALPAEKLIAIDNLVGYSLRVLQNVITDFRRSERRRAGLILIGGPLDIDRELNLAFTESEFNPDRVALDRETLQETLLAIGKLGRHRDEVARLVMNSYSIGEIAHLLGLGRSVVLRMIHEIRATVRSLKSDDAERDREQDPVRQDDAPAQADQQQLIRAIRRLGNRQAEVLIMSAEGLKPRQMAALLGIQAGAARASLSYARSAVSRPRAGPRRSSASSSRSSSGPATRSQASYSETHVPRGVCVVDMSTTQTPFSSLQDVNELQIMAVISRRTACSNWATSSGGSTSPSAHRRPAGCDWRLREPIIGGQWRRHCLLSVGIAVHAAALAGPRGGHHSARGPRCAEGRT